jgi:nitrate reductase gamma subunit
MKSEAKKISSVSGKLASGLIVAVVLVGAAAISGLAEVTEGSSVMSKIFMLFLGAVIVLQIVPCLMLVGAMCKGVVGMFGKTAKASAGRDVK